MLLPGGLHLRTLMRMYGLRSFANKFQELQLTAVAAGSQSRWIKLYPYASKRQRQRLLLQDAHHNQRNSHKPGTVQPRHVFG